MPIQPPVFFGDSALESLSDFIAKGAYDKVFIFVDTHTREHCLNLFLEEMPVLDDPEILEVEPGEATKDLEIASGLWQALAELGASRSSLLIHLGGGMVTDLGGYVASSYMRGIACVHVPTSLLAMVDAAHGGKTGLDVGGAKNLVGTWYDPQAIAVYPLFLETLPRQEWLSGWAEVIKHGWLAGGGLLDQVLGAEVPPVSIIQQAFAFKREVVAIDPREAGRRKILNLGHTLGHAIESYYLMTNNPMPHGFAIVLGMVAEMRLSEVCCNLSYRHVEAMISLSQRMYDFTPWEQPNPEEVISFMKFDKKKRAGKALFSLLQAPGEPVWDVEVSADAALEAVLFTLRFFEWKA